MPPDGPNSIAVTATQYFTELKAKIQKTNDTVLEDIYNSTYQMFHQMERMGQVDAMKKLYAHLTMLSVEHELLELGVDTFLFIDEVKEFIDKVDHRVVKLIELDRYEREIPEEVIQKFEKVKHLFSKFLVLFTDYTKEHTKKAARERDPILFGVLQDRDTRTTTQRLYVIGDWEDEFCDLTLDRLVSEARDVLPPNTPIAVKFRDPVSLEEIKLKLKALEAANKSSSNGWLNDNNFQVSGNTITAVYQVQSPPVPEEKEPVEVEKPESRIDEETLDPRSLFKEDSEIGTVTFQEPKKKHWWKFW